MPTECDDERAVWRETDGSRKRGSRIPGIFLETEAARDVANQAELASN